MGVDQTMTRQLVGFLSSMLFWHTVLVAANPVLISVKQGSHSFTPADSSNPSISEEGMVVVFESLAKLTEEDTDRSKDIYLYDRLSGKLKLLTGFDWDRKWGGATISFNGRWVACHAYLALPTKNDFPATADICLIPLKSGNPLWPLMENADTQVNGESIFPRFDSTGLKLVFTSNNTLLHPKANVGFSQIFLLDRKRDRIDLLSVNAQGEAANRSCGHPRLTADGSQGAFLSMATNMDPPLPPNNLTPHLYWFDVEEKNVMRVDTFERGFDDSEYVAGAFDLDDDGQALVFEARKRGSDPSKMRARANLFIFEQKSKQVRLLTTGLFSDKARNPSISGDGRYVAFVLMEAGGVVIYDRNEDRWVQAADGRCDNPVISKDGKVLVFERFDKTVKNVYVMDNPHLERK
ncbi:MAG: hypothetical protein KCHDKBKB_00252 [Elusimicrobia bacterium]|nr:hypothetical protein [Elusimicrobiota bacterium]